MTTADRNTRRVLLDHRDLVESRLTTARTVGDVWRIGHQLDALDAQLDHPGPAPRVRRHRHGTGHTNPGRRP